jgi:hypothetical protein
LDLFGPLASEFEEPTTWTPDYFPNTNIVNTPDRFEYLNLVMSESKRTRELREKLELAQSQNLFLEKECERLREELREAKWNGFST